MVLYWVMENRIYPQPIETVVTPEPVQPQSFDDPAEAVAALRRIYDRNTQFLRDSFAALASGGDTHKRYRAFYPEVGVTTASFTQVDSRQAYGHMPLPGHFSTTVTRPHLFETYLTEQLRLIIRNHGVPVVVQESTTPIPLHFAFLEGTYVDSSVAERLRRPIRDLFDVPDLDGTDDHIANGTFEVGLGEARPLAPFTAQRVDYSLHRLPHYTATSPEHFQNYVLFTNYQFYIDEFVARARQLMAEGGGGYSEFVEPGNFITAAGEDRNPEAGLTRLPQMPMCEQVVADYQTLRLSLKAHPMSFLRASMARQGFARASDLAGLGNGRRLQMAGLVLIRQRPGSAKGVCFITLEDETGVANLVVWPKVMAAFRKVIMTARLMQVSGRIQRDPASNVVHVVAETLQDRGDVLMRLSVRSLTPPLSRADEVRRAIPAPSPGHPRNARILPGSRDFH